MAEQGSSGMGRKVTILFSDALWQRVRERADEQGISASQYVREATVAILYYELRDQELKRVLEQARRQLRDRT